MRILAAKARNVSPYDEPTYLVVALILAVVACVGGDRAGATGHARRSIDCVALRMTLTYIMLFG